MKLDGEDAREFSYKYSVVGHTRRARTIIAQVGGVLYVFQFACDDAEYDKQFSLGDDVFKSFKWIKENKGEN